MAVVVLEGRVKGAGSWDSNTMSRSVVSQSASGVKSSAGAISR